MKKIVLVIFLAAVAVVTNTYAQETPKVDERQQNQHSRIREGVHSGELNRREARRLRHEQRHIRKAERRAKADGTVTRAERERLERKQNRASRDIRRQKHDAQ